MKLTFFISLAAVASCLLSFHLEDRVLQHQISELSRRSEEHRKSVINRVEKASSDLQRARKEAERDREESKRWLQKYDRSLSD